MWVAVTNNDKIYIFGGGLQEGKFPEGYYNSEMDIFDTINKFWTISTSGLIGRDGHTATLLPDTGEIVYIGGITSNNGTPILIDITSNVCYILYNFFS